MQPTKAYNGAVILVIGILSLVSCPLLGVVAWVMGTNTINAMQQDGVANFHPDFGMVNAGRILGIISTCLMCLGLCLYAALFGAIMGSKQPQSPIQSQPYIPSQGFK